MPKEIHDLVKEIADQAKKLQELIDTPASGLFGPNKADVREN